MSDIMNISVTFYYPNSDGGMSYEGRYVMVLPRQGETVALRCGFVGVVETVTHDYGRIGAVISVNLVEGD